MLKKELLRLLDVYDGESEILLQYDEHERPVLVYAIEYVPRFYNNDTDEVNSVIILK